MDDKVYKMTQTTPFSERTISVSEVNATIKSCLDSSIFKDLEVFGEISGYKFSGAHAYFTLKDKFSQLSCVCFNAARTYVPKDGESVLVRGTIDYYVKGGRLSLQAAEIVPVGQGLLFLEFERLKAKLSAEGLFDEEHKKPLPKYPQNVLVLTSKTGAVIRDIVTTVRRKNPVMNITVKDVRVQGDSAAREIAGALGRVDGLGYDVIVIARGGGSLEDLAPFYSEELVRAVYALNTPVISAVGHETDFSLCDFAADRRAATPTAAAELIAYDYYALVNEVNSAVAALKLRTQRLVERKALKTRIAAEKLGRSAVGYYRNRERSVFDLTIRMRSAAVKKSDATEFRLKSAIDALDRLSPLKILGRGYFRISAEGLAAAKVRDLSVGDIVTAIGGDGSFKAEVKEISLKKE